jgi:hypothetical protein
MAELTVVTSSTTPSQLRPVPRSPAELMADGKRLRDTVSRLSHGAWKKSADRPDYYRGYKCLGYGLRSYPFLVDVDQLLFQPDQVTPPPRKAVTGRYAYANQKGDLE